MPERGVRTRLGDGTPALIRDVGPQDAAALAEGFDGLSRESRLFRFLHAVERLPPSDIDMFTRPDHVLHEAIGAILIEGGRKQPAGIAHFFRGQADEARAEMSLAVIDAAQGRGLGSLLLGRLLKVAAARGIARFDAFVHSQNRAMIHMLLALGADERPEVGLRVFVLAVHRDPEAYPATPTGDAIRAAYALESAPLAA
ncbi:GNAT family N-acetyltransferase [Palleronia rufa]|uniref:GNAT family N-acetyltransferase n=1 Tax=Palleronia rufa TaxID=1530186 RepID=UPI001376DCEB|nr:GNAT family N-acetyltransferase [Palleronia rufa]